MVVAEIAPVNVISTIEAGRNRIHRGVQVLEVVAAAYSYCKPNLMAWMGRYHRVTVDLLDRLGIITVEAHSMPLMPLGAVNPGGPGPGHAESLADAVDGVEEPLVVEVVLALDKAAEFLQQLGFVSKHVSAVIDISVC